jgi:hypothetical protein
MDDISVLKLISSVFVIVLGIPNAIIDYKHSKNAVYEPGNAWGYYAKLAREGNWEGRFIMWSGYLGIYAIIGVTGYAFYALSR